MPDRDEPFKEALADLANALQLAVLLAEHAERTSAVTAQDVSSVCRNLKRATLALASFRAEGGAE